MKEELLEPILRQMRINRIKKYIPSDCFLCDVGCGFNAKFLLSMEPFVKKGIGFDKKVSSLKSNKIYLKNVGLDKTLPLESEQVNCVTLLAVLEHLEYPTEILQECHRILKSGGVLILTTPTPTSKPILEFLSFKLHIVNPVEIADHKNYFNGNQLTHMLKNDCGFDNVIAKTFQFGLNNLVIAYKGENK